MDNAKWWNTKGQLGRLGATALRRGFPRTHYFAQARSVFTVAANRCAEIFDHPDCVTLWRMPDEVEEAFDVRWERWVDHASEWNPFFESLDALPSNDLAEALRAFELVNERHIETFSKLRRSAEGRAVFLPGFFAGTEPEVVLLALCFAHGSQSAPTVPYARKADA
jgi:hypothetical protein